MRLRPDLLGRLPRPTALGAVELALLLLIAVQAARLAWVAVTPPGPVGPWRPADAALPTGSAVLAEFDPFFRLAAAGGPAVVTSLELRLFGVREDRATGRGSAIIGLPDGTQRSFAVGEEILPGVTLGEVGFDSVTIERGGAREQVFLDQSPPAPAAAAEAAAPPAPVQVVPVPPAPVPSDDRVRALRAAGLAPGDAIVAVNGQRVGSMEEALAIVRQTDGDVTLLVERGGRQLPMRVRF